MVVLSVALCTKPGKVLLSRQFVEMTRIRIEGLLAAFPKLIGTNGRQHTFVETESVRYVYLPIDNIYLLLITNRASNIVEDLETLKLLSKVVPSIAAPIGSVSTALTEEKILDTCFDLMFAFDEVITAGGYREPINMQQVRTNMEMESHEEKLHLMIKLSKMETAKDNARDAAKVIRERQREMARMGTGTATGFGNTDGFEGSGGGAMSMSDQIMAANGGGGDMYGGVGGGSSSSGSGLSSLPSPAPSSSSSSSSSSRAPLPPKKGMSLGSMGAKNKTLEDALLKEDKLAPVAFSSSRARNDSTSGGADSSSAAAGGASADSVVQQVQHPVMLNIAERVSCRMTRESVLEMFDIKGALNLTAATDEAACCSVQLQLQNSNMFSFITHPKVNKQLYEKSSLLQLKDPSKGFPSQRPVGILKWTFSGTGNDELVPLKINCWPEEEAGGNMNVSIEYEMQLTNKELHDVRIHIPLGTSDAPNIVSVDGSHRHNAGAQELVWHIDMIDSSNSAGSLEFNIRQKDSDAFFPIHCQFSSQQLYCNVDVVTVKSTAEDTPIVYGMSKGMSEDEYVIG